MMASQGSITNMFTITLMINFIVVLAFVDAFTIPPSFHITVNPSKSISTTSKLYSSMGGGMHPSVASLLDGEQEQVIANRAYVEEEILNKSPAPRDELKMATEEECKDAKKWIKEVLKVESKKDRSGSGGGFGGGGGGGMGKKKKGAKKKGAKSSKKNSDDTSSIPLSYNKFNAKVDVSGHGAILQKNGVARVNGVLSSSTSQNLLKYVDDLKLQSEEEVASGKVPRLSRFTRVLLKSNRCDLLLPFDTENDAMMQALYELLGDGKSSNLGAVGSVVESTISSDAELYEIACLISDPGSDRQVIHPDVAHQGILQKRTGPLITCFVALQDIDQSMGPSEFLLATNTAEYHQKLNDVSLRDEMLETVPSKISLLKEGDCSIFDGTTLHCGTGNKSQQRRRLFYFTFRSLAMEDPRTSNNPGSIRPEVMEAKLSLGNIRKEIRSWKEKKSN